MIRSQVVSQDRSGCNVSQTVSTCDWILRGGSLTSWIHVSLTTSVCYCMLVNHKENRKKQKESAKNVTHFPLLYIFSYFSESNCMMKPNPIFCLYMYCSFSDQITKHFGSCLHLCLMLATCDWIIWHRSWFNWTLGHMVSGLHYKVQKSGVNYYYFFFFTFI